MHTRLRLAVLVVVAASAVRAAGQAAASEAPQPRVAVTITLPQTVLKADSEVRIGVSIKNTSNQDHFISKHREQGHAESYNRIEVRDDKGNLVPVVKPREAPRTKDGLVTALATWSEPAVDLKPGETLQDEIVASEMFDLHRPGKYTIQVKTFDQTSKTFVKSNIITVTVTE